MKRDLKLITFAAALLLTVGSLAPVVAASRTVASPVCSQDPAPPGDAERGMFTQGQNLFLQGSYTRAADVLERFLTTYPNSILTDLTLLWLGRSYLQLGKLTEAEDVGKRLHAIKDTPFADMYDTELLSVRNEAARQLSSTVGEDTPASPAQRTSSSIPPLAGRSRFAKPQLPVAAASTPKPGNAAAATVRRSAPKPQATKSTGPPRAARTAGGSSKQKPAQLASTNKPRPETQSGRSGLVRKSDSTKRQAVAKTSRRPATTTTHARNNPRLGSNNLAGNRDSSTGRRIGVMPKPAPAVRQAARSGVTGGRKPVVARKKNSSKSELTRRTTPNLDRSKTPQRAVNTENKPTTQTTTSATDSSGTASQSPRPTSVNAHAATGGLYSMIDAGLTPSAAPGPALGPAPSPATGPATGPAPNSALPAKSAPAIAGDTRVEAKSKGMYAKPGETVYLSFIVGNYTPVRNTYELRISSPGAPEAQLFVDSNGDGLHQNDELKVTGAPVIELKNSEVPFLLQVTIPPNAGEGQRYSYTVTVIAFGSGEVVARTTSTLTVSSIRGR